MIINSIDPTLTIEIESPLVKQVYKNLFPEFYKEHFEEISDFNPILE